MEGVLAAQRFESEKNSYVEESFGENAKYQCVRRKLMSSFVGESGPWGLGCTHGHDGFFFLFSFLFFLSFSISLLRPRDGLFGRWDSVFWSRARSDLEKNEPSARDRVF